MRIDGTIYNYLSSTLTPKKRNTTHKSAELKEVYNSMVRYNKNSPLFLIPMTESNQEYIINIKEAALTLKDVTQCFISEDSELYSKKRLYSDDSAAISGSLNTASGDKLPEKLSISLEQLASKQVNTGNYINSGAVGLSSGVYSFNISSLQGSSRFSITVSKGDTNLDIQERLAQYINNRNLDINAAVTKDGNRSALILSSTDTGAPATDDGLYFTIEADNDTKLIDMLGIANISKAPADSIFYINDELHSAGSNHISINQSIELDFHSVTDKPVTISLVPDSDAAMHQIDMFVDAYNSLVKLSDSEFPSNVGSRNLYNDISGIVNNHRNELENAGLIVDDDRTLKKDDTIITKKLYDGSFSKLFRNMSSLHNDIEAATNRMALDPMAYINKLMVTYPNTQNKFSTAYNQSLYSGLIFNNYV